MSAWLSEGKYCLNGCSVGLLREMNRTFLYLTVGNLKLTILYTFTGEYKFTPKANFMPGQEFSIFCTFHFSLFYTLLNKKGTSHRHFSNGSSALLFISIPP